MTGVKQNNVMCVRFCKIYGWFPVAKPSAHNLRAFILNVKFCSFAASRPHNWQRVDKTGNLVSHKHASETDGLIPRWLY